MQKKLRVVLVLILTLTLILPLTLTWPCHLLQSDQELLELNARKRQLLRLKMLKFCRISRYHDEDEDN